jgi:hypothetical protein
LTPALLQDRGDLMERCIAGIHHQLDRRAVVTGFLDQLLGLIDVIGQQRHRFGMEVHDRHIGVRQLAEAEIDGL